MKVSHSIRVITGFIIIIILVLFNTISAIKKTGIISLDDFGQDKRSTYLTRFETIRDTVRSQDTVGYLGDHRRGEYFLAQYAFAPALLDGDVKYSLVIVNFENERPDSVIEFEKEMRLLIDLNNGVRLYQGIGH